MAHKHFGSLIGKRILITQRSRLAKDFRDMTGTVTAERTTTRMRSDDLLYHYVVKFDNGFICNKVPPSSIEYILDDSTEMVYSVC